eukprot:m51a1_g12239 putative gdp-fucose transporter 1 (358) ;mRNA; f:101543-103138
MSGGSMAPASSDVETGDAKPVTEPHDAAAKGKLAEATRIASVVAFYFVVSIALVFLNKYIMQGRKFGYPIFITWYQQVVGLVCIASLGWAGTRVSALSFMPPAEFHKDVAREIAPLTVIFVGMLAFNNLCLNYVEVWYYQVARSLTILFSVCFTYYFLGQTTSRRALTACGVVVVGFLLGSFRSGGGSATPAEEDPQARSRKILGVVFGILSSAFVALYSIFVKRKLPVVGNNEWRLSFYNTTLSTLFLAPLVLVAGEQGVFWEPALLDARFWAEMTVTGVFGALIAVAIFMQIKATSPLTNTISGTAKACVQTLLAIVLWGSAVSTIEAVGIILVIGGSFWYSLVRYNEMQLRQPK